MFVSSAISVLLFIYVESRVSQPFISLKLLSIRNVFLSNFTGLFSLAGMFFLFYSVPSLLQYPSSYGFGLSVETAGLYMLPVALISMLFAPISAFLTKKRGPKPTILVGSILLFAAFLALYYNRGSAMSVLEDIILMGFGLSFIFVGVINILIVSSPASEAGVSTGMNVVFRNIGSAIASAIAGVYMTLYSVNVPVSLTKTVSIPTSEAYDHVYLIGMLFLVISLVFTLLMKNAVMVPDKSGIKEKSPLPGNSGSK